MTKTNKTVSIQYRDDATRGKWLRTRDKIKTEGMTDEDVLLVILERAEEVDEVDASGKYADTLREIDKLFASARAMARGLAAAASSAETEAAQRVQRISEGCDSEIASMQSRLDEAAKLAEDAKAERNRAINDLTQSTESLKDKERQLTEALAALDDLRRERDAVNAAKVAQQQDRLAREHAEKSLLEAQNSAERSEERLRATQVQAAHEAELAKRDIEAADRRAAEQAERASRAEAAMQELGERVEELASDTEGYRQLADRMSARCEALEEQVAQLTAQINCKDGQIGKLMDSVYRSDCNNPSSRESPVDNQAGDDPSRIRRTATPE